ncbi:MAG TPA: FecR domain-containing protein [Alphaproteobacteria bacterium]
MNDNRRDDEGLRLRDGIEGEAAAWVVRLGAGPLSAAENAALAQWMSKSPAHADAFAYACDLWGDPAWKVLTVTASVQDVAAPPRRRGLWAGALAAGLALFALLGLQHFGDPWTALRADYRSLPAEVRAVTLADGSRVDLNSASAIAVDYSDRTRSVRLLAGEALFSPKPLNDAETRPFVVAAGGLTARALGTRFVVAREPGDAVSVGVLEHQVEVAAPGADGETEHVVLTPGQSLRYAASQLGAVRQEDVAQDVAWSRGQLVFDRVALSQAVEVLNRYRHERIIVADANLAGRRVSGLFRLDDLSGALDTITAELGARSARVPLVATVIY